MRRRIAEYEAALKHENQTLPDSEIMVLRDDLKVRTS